MIPKLIIHPEASKREQYAQELIASLKFNINHPDLMWFEPEAKLGIEQAKKIKNFLKLKPYQSEGQMIVIVTAENLTDDAQNALLKTLEEHADGVNFILGVSSEDQLLPTIISRCQIINLPAIATPDVTEKYQKDIESLINFTIEQRFQFIEKLKEKEEFLPALIIYFRHNLYNPFKKSQGGASSTPPRWDIDFLIDLVEAEKWVNQNVNIRAILEYLMLKMPKN